VVVLAPMDRFFNQLELVFNGQHRQVVVVQVPLMYVIQQTL
jgi:hypothetical protein